MGRKLVWFILVVALLVVIFMEAASADGNGGGGGNGKGGEGNGAGGQGNDNGSEGDGQGGKGGHDNGGGKGQGGNYGNGNGGEDGQGNQDGNGKGQGDGNGKGEGNGKGQGDGNGKGQGDGNGKGEGNGHGNKQPPPPPPPPSQTPPYYPPPSQTPPNYPPPSSTPPPPQTPPNYPPPTSTPPPPQTPPNYPPPSSTPPPPQTPPNYPPPSSTPPPPQTPETPPNYPPPSSTPPPPQTPETPPNYPPPSSTPPPPQTPQTPPNYPPPSPTPTPPSQPPPTGDSTDYYMVSPVERTGQERAVCEARETCNRTLTCPAECPHRRPNNYHTKGCFIHCSKCEATCKWRKPNCDNYGSLCYDPRFVGGDGNMFYFHGSKGSDFAIVTDEKLQINAHFIGTRPMGRTRDFTWVQAISIMFDSHTLVLAAKRVSKWDDKVEALIVKLDGKTINIPINGEAEWRINTENRYVIVERTDEFNTVRATVSGLVQVDTRVVPIGEQENKVHHYQIPADDAFAHLETQFKFFELSDSVEGVLGRTYQEGFESPVKMGVPMPMMGGEDKYQTPSLNSPLCKLCKFKRPINSIAMVTAAI